MTDQEKMIELAPGLSMPRVVTGLWQIADMERDDQHIDLEATARCMSPYVDAGLTAFDMADHYGSAELIAGIYAKQFAGERPLQLMTKWVPKPGGSSAQVVREAVERALSRLQGDTIQLLQYHAWNYADPSYLDELLALEALRQEGLIQHIGLTNFDTAHLHVVLEAGIPVVSNQVCYSLLDQRASGAMRELCLERGVKLLAFGTLAGGFLSDRWLGLPEPTMDSLTTWSQMKYKRYIDNAGGWERFQSLLSVLNRIAQRTGLSLANVASRFVLEQPAVGAVIIGARLGESEHIASNCELLERGLDAEAITLIRETLATLTPIPGDCGDEYRKPPFLTASGDLSHHIDSLPAPFPTQRRADGALQAMSGTIWEDIAGFARAVRHGDRICVSGTTATHGQLAIGPTDVVAQTHFVIDKIEGSLQSLGAGLENVVRTRIFVRNIEDWEAVSRVHGQRFGNIQPANTLVRADLVGDEYLVEIEAEAIAPS